MLASDRLTSYGDRKIKRTSSKCFNKPIRVKTDNKDEEEMICAVIGLTGRVNISNYIKYGFLAPEIEKDEDFTVYLVSTFLPELKKGLKEAGIIKVDNSMTDINAEFLLFYKGKVYKVDDSLGITDTDFDFDAVGSGSEYALGSLSTTSKKMKPENRVKKAIEVASDHTRSVGFDIDIVRLRGENYECK